ncbi:hypothetical protein V8C35DRAFT_272882 [Trichoderma chlorosporum]
MQEYKGRNTGACCAVRAFLTASSRRPSSKHLRDSHQSSRANPQRPVPRGPSAMWYSGCVWILYLTRHDRTGHHFYPSSPPASQHAKETTPSLVRLPRTAGLWWTLVGERHRGVALLHNTLCPRPPNGGRFQVTGWPAEVLGGCVFDMGARRLLQPFGGTIADCYLVKARFIPPGGYSFSQSASTIRKRFRRFPPHRQGQLDPSNAVSMTSIIKDGQAAWPNFAIFHPLSSAAGIAEAKEREASSFAYLYEGGPRRLDSALATDSQLWFLVAWIFHHNPCNPFAPISS